MPETESKAEAEPEKILVPGAPPTPPNPVLVDRCRAWLETHMSSPATVAKKTGFEIVYIGPGKEKDLSKLIPKKTLKALGTVYVDVGVARSEKGEIDNCNGHVGIGEDEMELKYRPETFYARMRYSLDLPAKSSEQKKGKLTLVLVHATDKVMRTSFSRSPWAWLKPMYTGNISGQSEGETLWMIESHIEKEKPLTKKLLKKLLGPQSEAGWEWKPGQVFHPTDTFEEIFIFDSRSHLLLHDVLRTGYLDDVALYGWMPEWDFDPMDLGLGRIVLALSHSEYRTLTCKTESGKAKAEIGEGIVEYRILDDGKLRSILSFKDAVYPGDCIDQPDYEARAEIQPGDGGPAAIVLMITDASKTPPKYEERWEYTDGAYELVGTSPQSD